MLMAHFDDQTALVQALFASATGTSPETGAGKGPAPWQPFLERLRQVMQADGTALSIEQDDGLHSYCSAGACAVLDPEDWQSLRNDRVYAQDSLPAGIKTEGFIRAVKARVGQEARIVVWAQRAAHRKDFRSADGQQLSALVPYLGQAGEIWLGLCRERRHAALNARLAADLGARWILFDRTGTVLDLSAATLAWAGQAGLRLSKRKRLDLPDPLATQQLRTAFSACAADAGGPVGVALAHDPIVELVLTRDACEGEGVLIGFLREAPPAASLPIKQIARHFGLSRSEARLAALLCDGFTLRAAAVQLGWTEETARSCSKKIFSRTEVRGQADLLRKILGSAVWFRGEA